MSNTYNNKKLCLINFLRRNPDVLYECADMDQSSIDFVDGANDSDCLTGKFMNKFMYSTISGLPIRLFADEHFDIPCPHDKRNKDTSNLDNLHKCPVGVVFLDIVGFKGVNDHIGYEYGNQLLRALGQWLQGRIELKLPSKYVIVVHYGGDEFAVFVIHKNLPCQDEYQGEQGDLAGLVQVMKDVKNELEQQTLLLIMKPKEQKVINDDVRFITQNEKIEDYNVSDGQLHYYFKGISMAYGVDSDYAKAQKDYELFKSTQRRDNRVRGALMFDFRWKNNEYISLLSNHIFVIDTCDCSDLTATLYSEMIRDTWKYCNLAAMRRQWKKCAENISEEDYIENTTPKVDCMKLDGYLIYRMDLTEWTSPQMPKDLPLLFETADKKAEVEKEICKQVQTKIKKQASLENKDNKDYIMLIGLKA